MIRSRERDASGPLACSAAPHPYPSRCSAVPGLLKKISSLEVGHGLVGTEVPPRAGRTAHGGHLLDPPRAGTAAPGSSPGHSRSSAPAILRKGRPSAAPWMSNLIIFGNYPGVDTLKYLATGEDTSSRQQLLLPSKVVTRWIFIMRSSFSC
jgi:hypothetical protein